MEMRKNDSAMNADTFHHLLSLARFVVFITLVCCCCNVFLLGWCHSAMERTHYLLNNGLLPRDWTVFDKHVSHDQNNTVLSMYIKG